MSLSRLVPLAALLAAPLAGCDDVSLDDLDAGGATVSFSAEDVQLLPAGFPLYPKAFSTESLDGLVDAAVSDFTVRSAIESVAGDICESVYGVTVCLDDLLGSADYSAIDAAVADQVPEVRDWLAGKLVGQLAFYDTAPLGTGIHEQLGRMFAGKVEFTEVKLTMKVRNATDAVWGVPVRLKLYAGDGATIHDKGGLVVAANADTGGGEVGSDYTVLLRPGESATIETDNLAGLVDSLNAFRGFAVDYDADIEVTDIDPQSFADWLGRSKTDADGNGVADELKDWALVLDDFRITVSGQGEVEFPTDVPAWLEDYVVAATSR